MTNKMENLIWKKIRNDNATFLQQQQQQQQQQQSNDSTNSSDMNNLATTLNLFNLNSLLLNKPDNNNSNNNQIYNDYPLLMNGNNNSTQQNGSKYLPLTSISTNKMGNREIGRVEKMLTSYGFVQCIDREGRYFFHYSSFQGGTSNLKIGDIVEFEESIDKRTGKPIAINLTKPLGYNKNQSFFDSTQTPTSLAAMNFNDNSNSYGSNSNLHSNNENFNDLLTSPTNNNNLNNYLNYLTTSNNKLMMQKSIQNGITNSNNNSSKNLFSNNVNEVVSMDETAGSIAIVSTKDYISGLTGIRDGRITYERNGETFYIPYARNDTLDRMQEFKAGDRIRFQIVQNIATGAVFARIIDQIQPRTLARGVVTTCKDTFGRIEREDVNKEIFFHITDYKGGNVSDLCVGANVEFEIQDRHGKEIACNIKLLPLGTVCFDEIDKISYIGRILKYFPNLKESNSQGKIIFDFNEEKFVEIIFYERDRIGEFTLFEGDFVQFRVATDKRTKSKRAVDVLLMEQSFNNKEKRECGIVERVFESQQQNNNKIGAIKSIERDELIYFTANELVCLNNKAQLKSASFSIGDCVEFSVAECQKDPLFKSGLKALRIKLLPPNAVVFETVSSETYIGYIEKDAVETKTKSQDKLNANRRSDTSLAQDALNVKSLTNGSGSNSHGGLQSIASSPAFSSLIQQQKNDDNKDVKYEAGIIKYEYKGETKQIPYYSYSICLQNGQKTKPALHYLDQVEFNIHTVVKDNKQTAVNVKLVKKNIEQGFIAVLKDNYGFIEMVSQPKDLFFHYSSTVALDLDIGDEVEFYLRKNGSKMNAENVVKLANGTIQTHNLVPYLYKGRVLQPLRSLNNDQDEYYGKVQIYDDGQSGDVYQFGLSGLSDKKMILLAGDIVSFQVGISPDGSKKAFNITKKEKDLRRAKIDSIKSQHGFIDFAIGDSKKLIFYMTDVENASQTELKAGDEVEFSISYNNRNNKYFANKVKKLNVSTSDQALSKRPERLITKLKVTNVDDNGKQLILIRQPRNPDMKAKSFSKQRVERLPGQLTPNEISSILTPDSQPAKNSNDEPKISHFNNLITQS